MEAALNGCAVVLSGLLIYRIIWTHGRNALLHPASDRTSLCFALHTLAQQSAYRQHLARVTRRNVLPYHRIVMVDRMRLILKNTAAVFGPEVS